MGKAKGFKKPAKKLSAGELYEKIKPELQESQHQAFDDIIAFFKIKTPSYTMMLLSGSAGTGKTYLIGKIAEYLKNSSFCNVLMSAPTNKAVKVLRDTLELRGGVDFSTIHSALGLREEIDDYGNLIFKNQNREDVKIYDYDYVMLDEASMVDAELFTILLEELKDTKVKLLFVGDRYQIPPVNYIDSVIFDETVKQEYGIKEIALTTIIRQHKDNPIIGLANEIRSNLSSPNIMTELAGNVKFQNSKQVVFLPQDKQTLIDVLSKYFVTEEFDENADYCKVLAWTNANVNKFNTLIRKIKYGTDVPQLVVGEKIIFDKPWHEKGHIVYTTNEEATVRSFNTGTMKLFDEDFTYYDTAISKEGSRIAHKKRILILKEECFPVFEKTKLRLKNNALGHKKGSIDSKGWWAMYYQFIGKFAAIKYSYSITCHKCLPLNALILTPLGTVELQNLHRQNIVSSDGTYQPVLNYIETGLKDEYFIRTRSGRRFTSSAEHRFLSENNNYVAASSLKVKNYVAVWRNNEVHNFVFNPKYYFYGFLVGDGCYSYQSNRIDISILPEANILPFLMGYMQQYGQPHIYRRKENRAICLSVESKKLREQMLLDGLHRVSRSFKRCPIFTSKNDKANFIRGLMDSDGSCSDKYATMRFVNTSEFVIDTLMMLLQEFGIIANKFCRVSSNPNHSDAYTVSITGNNCLLYMQQIGFSLDYKIERLNKVCTIIGGKTNNDNVPPSTHIKEIIKNIIRLHKTDGGRQNKGCGLYTNKCTTYGAMLKHKHFSYRQLSEIINHLQQRNITIPEFILEFVHNNYFWDEIVECGYTGKQIPMADIEVDGNHSFIYNGAIVHNSQGSTYINAIVANYDINNNHSIIERNRIKYTAVTRPKENLYIIV